MSKTHRQEVLDDNMYDSNWKEVGGDWYFSAYLVKIA